MGTDIARLKSRKGRPPDAGAAQDVTADSGRADGVALRPLQVRVPVDVFEAFSEQAGREFGFSHGAKKKLFLKMWDEYRQHASMR